MLSIKKAKDWCSYLIHWKAGLLFCRYWSNDYNTETYAVYAVKWVWNSFCEWTIQRAARRNISIMTNMALFLCRCLYKCCYLCWLLLVSVAVGLLIVVFTNDDASSGRTDKDIDFDSGSVDEVNRFEDIDKCRRWSYCWF